MCGLAGVLNRSLGKILITLKFPYGTGEKLSDR
jgi:hypothetical protein